MRAVLTGDGRQKPEPAALRGRRAGAGDGRCRPVYILARGEVHHVGDAVAFVVADTLDQARDAAEAIEIDWEPLPHVIGAEAALAAERAAGLARPAGQSRLRGRRSATRSKTKRPSRRPRTWSSSSSSTSGWSPTTWIRAAWSREYDKARDHYTLTLGSQGSHAIRDIIGGRVLGIAPEKMRVITPDVGGGFGTKLFAYREYALAAFAAKLTGKPVNWIADRTEHFLGDTHGRDNITTARLALDRDGRFLALDVDTIADMGAYLSTYAPYIPYIGAGMLPGVYDIPACFIRVRAAYTNTVPVDAYRGAGRPEASYVIERLVDAAARETGIAPDELRRKNFIRPEQMPYKTATGKTYDTGEFDGQMSRALELADCAGLCRARRGGAKARAAARHRDRDLYRGLRRQRPGHRDAVARRRTAPSMSMSAPRPRGRATTPPIRRSSPTICRCRPNACACCRATPRRSRPAPAPAARARSRPAAIRWRWRRRSSPIS